MGSILDNIIENKAKGRKSFAVLLDPDNIDPQVCMHIVDLANENKVDYFFVGGSLLTDDNIETVIKIIKQNSSIPVMLFPGSLHHINNNADSILLLSLISGRNPDFLIGQHVIAAPILKKSILEIIPTGYMLIDCGNPTTVSYMSNTTPIPFDKPSIASCTAMAGEMLGLKLIYMDGGSGAKMPISKEMIEVVKSSCNLPIIVGGGMDTPEKAFKALRAGADLIVIGNAIEKNPTLIAEVTQRIAELNIH